MATTMYDRVVAVISNPPDERPPQTIAPLIPWIRKKADVFGALTADVVADIIKNCEFVTRPRDDVIIKQGDKGDCFYIILRGSVSIYINNLISDEEDESKIAEHSRGAQYFTEKGELDRSKFGNYIVQFATGKSFGELALINKNCIRNASIIIDEDTDLLVVNRELYNRSLRAAQAAEFEERNSFVRDNMLFMNWAPKHKKQLAMSLEKVKVPFEGFISRQGELVNRLYFVLRGQAKVLVDGTHHQTQFPQFYPLEDPDKILAREELEQGSVQHLAPRRKEQHSAAHERPSAVAPYAQRVRERAKKLTELSIVSTKEIIGDTEFVLELKSYVQSVECTQTCEVYALDIKNYERLVTKRNPKTVELLRQNAQVKLAGRTARLTEDQAPLLKTLLFKLQRLDRTQQTRNRRKDDLHSPFVTNNDIVPQRGPLIDMFGPGTVFYRSKMREQAKMKQKTKQNFRGVRGGFRAPMTQISQGNKYDSQAVEPHPNGAFEAARSDESDEEDGGTIQTDRAVHPYGSTFSDYKSSDKALSVLETRIKNWHSTIVTPKQRKTCPPSAVKLERVQLDKSKELVPGRTVILRKKRPHVVSLGFNSHSDDFHVRQAFSSPECTTRATTSSGGMLTELNSSSDDENLEDKRASSCATTARWHSAKYRSRENKGRPRRNYTADDYKELKKKLQYQERSVSSLGAY